jgi:hypothetical protein
MNTRKYSNLQERRIAKKLQGKKQLNSGATMFAKGDVVTDNFLVECKTKIKDSKSISIQKEWIEKLKEECFAMRKPYWAISFSFGDNEDYFIINEKLFKQLMEACNNE